MKLLVAVMLVTLALAPLCDAAWWKPFEDIWNKAKKEAEKQYNNAKDNVLKVYGMTESECYCKTTFSRIYK